MGYLICENCGGYYKLKDGESVQDFVSCECYGTLIYVEELDKSENSAKTNIEVDETGLETGSKTTDNLDSTDLEDKLDFRDLKDNSYAADLKDNIKELRKESESDFNSIKKEPIIKNRAYYRRFNYYSEPDIEELKRLKDVAGLINALYYDDPEIKLKTVKVLTIIGDDRALEHLEKVINEESGTLKIYAEIAVNQIKSRKHGLKSRNRNHYRNIPYEPSKTSLKLHEVKTGFMDSKMESSISISPNKSTHKSRELQISPNKTSELIYSPSKSVEIDDANLITDEVENEARGSEIQTPNIKHINEESSSEPERTDLEDSDVETLEVKPPKIKSSLLESKDVKSAAIKIPADKPSELEIIEVNTSCVSPYHIQIDVNPPVVPHLDVKSLGYASSNEINHKKPKRSPIQMKTYDDSQLGPVRSINKPSQDFKTFDSSKMDGPEKTEDGYFIKWLGIKNSDKPLIGFIFLFALALIVGVILTMNSK